MGEEKSQGHLHPLSQIITQATEVFRDLGFSIVSGPEIEEEFYNFDALNIPADHPARAMQDTFWLKPDQFVSQTGVGLKQSKRPFARSAGADVGLKPAGADVGLKQSSGLDGKDKREVLRTHTTSVDARYLKTHEPPFRILAPGRVFRNEATDATHEAQFYQIDGLVVEENVSLANLKWMLEHFYRSIFGAGLEFRWRPSYFSFVEPGLELDIKWGERWLEVVGCGMLHPNVFKAAGRDPSKWRGLAFGSTVDRLAMLKYGITDIRQLYQGDQRFLNQF